MVIKKALKILEGRLDEVLVGLLIFFVYVKTLAPTVTTGDSGELINAAANLEVAHATGFPIYLLLGHLFIKVFFFLKPAWVMNALSAVWGTAACLVVRRIVLLVTKEKSAALGAALLLAFSDSFWSQANQARVYSLNALLVGLVVYYLLKQQDEYSCLRRAYLFLGLALANHTVSMILLVPLAIVTWRPTLSLKQKISAASFSLLGISLYLYVPLAARAHRYQLWGDPSTWERFIEYMSRREFWERRYVRDWSTLLAAANNYLCQIATEFTWLGALLIIIGLIYGWRKHRRVVLLAVYLFMGNFVLNIAHGDRSAVFIEHRYLIVGWLALAIIGGLGMSGLFKKLKNWEFWLTNLIVFLLGIANLSDHYPANDLSDNTVAHDYAAKILSMLPPGALLFASDDNMLHPLIYLHHVEKQRPDIEMVLMGINTNNKSTLTVPARERPCYFTQPLPLNIPEFFIEPDGLLTRVIVQGEKFTPRPWRDWAIASFEAREQPGALRYLDRNLHGWYFLNKAISEQDDAQKVIKSLRRAQDITFDYPKLLTQYGALFELNLLFEQAQDVYVKALKIDEKFIPALAQLERLQKLLAKGQTAQSEPEKMVRLAIALHERGDEFLAKKLLRQTQQKFPFYFAAYFNLAVMQMKAGDYAAAAQNWREALKRKPNDEETIKHLRFVEEKLRRAEPAPR